MEFIDAILWSRTLGMHEIQPDEAMLINLVGTLGQQGDRGRKRDVGLRMKLLHKVYAYDTRDWEGGLITGQDPCCPLSSRELKIAP